MSGESGSGCRLPSKRGKDEEQQDEQRYCNNSLTRSTAIPTHCLVSGSLALILRMSRMAGIAPLAFEKQGLGFWEVRKSRSYFIYSVILIIILNVIAVLGLAIDMTVDREQAVRLRTPTKSVMFYVDVIVVGLTMSVSTFTAPSRMEAMIGILSRLQKINLKINNNNVPAHIDKRLKYMVVFFVCFPVFITSCQLYMFISYTFANNRNRTIVLLYLAFYCLYINLIFINLQFAITVITISRPLKTINDHLEHLCLFIKNEGLQNKRDNEMKERVPLKSVNIVIHRFTYDADILLPRKMTIHETIRSLAHSYLDVCNLMKEVNKCFGVIALMRLLVSLAHLTLTSYYFFMAFYTNAEFNRTILLQSFSFIKDLITIFLLVEPCHWTYQEFIRTRQLMVRLTCRTANIIGPFVLELRRFFYCICLNNIEYAPMGICTLTRPITVSILGAMTTYLVIVIQFNTDDDLYDHRQN